MELDNVHAETIVAHLDRLNAQITKQNSFSRMFIVGLFYGIGFVVGSAIFATILIGFLAPWVAQIPGVREAFITGIELIRGE